MTLGWLMIGAALIVSAVAAVYDTRTGRIPNWLSLPPLVAAPFVYLALGGPLALAQSLVGLLAGGIVPFLLFHKDAAGGGDVKLLAAIGALTGASFAIEAQMIAFTAAALYALVITAKTGMLKRLLTNAALLALSPLSPRAKRARRTETVLTPIRLGLPIFVGVMLSAWLAAGSQGGPF